MTTEYLVPLINIDGEDVEIWAVGLDRLTSESPSGGLEAAYQVFGDVDRARLERPEGAVDILLGQDYAGFLPRVVESRGHLLLLSSQFGSGLLLSGRLEGEGRVVCDHVMSEQALEYGRGTRNLPSNAVLVNHVQARLPSFFEVDDLACPLPPSCKEHRDATQQCRECTFRGDRVSRREREALAKMEDSLHKGEDGRLYISYPFNFRALDQRDNRHQARQVQVKVEETVKRKGVEQEYREEMKKALEAGSLRLITTEEQENWRGPVHFISHFGVVNVESTSTKVRVVANSAMKNANSGHSFNDTTDNVPNVLNDLFDVLVQWRGHTQALMYDLSKAYQSVRTGDLELHLRRIVYREEVDQEFNVYGYTCATFGDDPAGAALELAKRWTAQEGMEVDSLAARQLVTATYVDDGGGGGTKEEVRRMRGEKKGPGEYTGTLPKILSLGGFRAKALIVGGDCDEEEAEALGGKFLGVPYDPVKDTICMGLRTTIRARHQKQERGKASQFISLDEEFVSEVLTGNQPLTKRKILGLVMSQYDPLGLLSPLLIQAKLLLRQLYGKDKENNWDLPLSPEAAQEWTTLITAANQCPGVEFPRQLSPEEGEVPEIISFWDGSLAAHGACVYLRWELPSGQGVVRLVTAKSRVAPLAGATVQRMELQGMAVCCRLTKRVLEALDFRVRSVTIVGDSMCCLMAVRKDGVHFNPYFQHRLCDIVENMEKMKDLVDVVHPPHWVDGTLNPADMCTKAYATASDIGPGSLWQQGPAFLSLPRHMWDITVPDQVGGIPEKEMKVKKQVNVVLDTPVMGKVVLELLERKGKLDVVIGAVARLARAVLGGSREKITRHPADHDRKVAEKLLLVVAQGEVRVAWEQGKLQALNPREKDGLVVTSGRFSHDRMLALTGHEALPIIMGGSMLARHYCVRAHQQDHYREPNSVLARTRQHVWIVGGRKVAREVARGCMKCRMEVRKPQEQLMGKVDDMVGQAAIPFQYVCVDLFGPLLTRGLGGHARSSFKTWGASSPASPPGPSPCGCPRRTARGTSCSAWTNKSPSMGNPRESTPTRAANWWPRLRRPGSGVASLRR